MNMIQAKRRLVLVMLIAALLFTTVSSLAQPAISDPREGLYEWSVAIQPLFDAKTVMRNFFGDAESTLRLVEPDAGEGVQYSSPDYKATFTWIARKGFFRMDKPGNIPRDYFNEDDSLSSRKSPRPSETPGKYLPEEAAEEGLRFLRDALGMDTSALYPKEINALEHGKERARIYSIQYAYQIGGREVIAWPTSFGIQMLVSDDGVEMISSGKAVVFSQGAAIPPDHVKTEEDILDSLKRKNQYREGMKFTLSYQTILGRDGSFCVIPSWIEVAEHDNVLALNALTEEMVDMWVTDELLPEAEGGWQ
ncbi:MAG: hypothetical protein RR843_05005 [Clostridia bacterium]